MLSRESMRVLMYLLNRPYSHSIAGLGEELNFWQVCFILCFITRRGSVIDQVYQLSRIELSCLIKDRFVPLAFHRAETV